MKALRLAFATVLVTVAFGITPASANDCSNPKQSCGGCSVNWEISTDDLRPVVCHF